MKSSDLEIAMAGQISVFGLPPAVQEYRFHPARRWRFDFAWPDRKIAVEVEGGTWSGGRHTRGSGFEADCDKYNAAALDGWTVFRFTAKHIDSGEAVLIIRAALQDARPAIKSPESGRSVAANRAIQNKAVSGQKKGDPCDSR